MQFLSKRLIFALLAITQGFLTHCLTINKMGPEIVQLIENKQNKENNVTLLTEIHHFTRQEMSIDISLNKESFEEECYVRPPNGEPIRADLFKMENVTVQSSSNYVSCRITVGPMSEHLLGLWILCGKSKETDEMRCQPAKISWNNNNAIAVWESLIQPRFRHPVHFGGSVNPGVDGRGDVLSCHVVTPNGEDLVMKSDVKYPHIERIALDMPSLCSINYTNIDRSSIGDWSIYGKFRSVLVGLNEVHLPLNFFLYNEKYPYQQAYNVTVLPEDRRIVILGTDLGMEVTNDGGEVDDCQFRMPSGQSFDLHSVVTIEGIVFNKSHTDTACRLSINHITKEMVGKWQIIGKFSNENQFFEKQQTLYIIQEDPGKPIIDETRVVENFTKIIVDTNMGAIHRVTINSTGFVEHESCQLLTPNGSQYAFIPGFDIDHVEVIDQNGVECGVVVHVLTQDMIGEWTLIARATRFSEPIERRLPFTIRVEETSSLGNAINITEGADLYLALPETTDLYETCKLYGPDDVEVTNYDVDPMKIHVCGYIVRGVKSYHNGTWKIIYGNRIIYRASVEVNILEPLLRVEREFVDGLEGDPVVMSCSVAAAIRYCYFRADNGTTFNVRPSISSPHYEYEGSGFDAGECGIRFSSLLASDSGRWSCHVGLTNSSADEQQAFLQVVVKEKLSVVYTWEGTSIVVRSTVYKNPPLDYCRFIRSDGLGFTSDNLPPGYNITPILNKGRCNLHIFSPSILDQHLWTVAAKITGVDGEITKSTTDTLLLHPPQEPKPEATLTTTTGTTTTGTTTTATKSTTDTLLLHSPQEPKPEATLTTTNGTTTTGTTTTGISVGFAIFIGLFVIIIGFILISAGVALIPKKNREWTYDRARCIRNSFRKQSLHF